jgi:hypothetical protein
MLKRSVVGWVAVLGFVLIVPVSIANAGVFSFLGGSEKWKEEVQLTDGKIVIIDRETISENGGDEWAFNRSGTKPKEYRIRFPILNEKGKSIEWKSTKFDDRKWPEVPLIFDVRSNQPIVYSLVAVSICCEIYSKYVYQNGSWTEEKLPETFEQLTTNLFFGDSNNMPSFLNLKEKEKRNAGVGYRQALKQVGPSRKIKFQ